jgi:2-polyprenyl-6-methoxyphenol hydroxylase-like FAD-dependent oxidoreductase
MKTRSYTEPAKDVPVLAECDVAVCGGGPAGCAAAIAAARRGARTLLIEKYGYLGGATVSQLVTPILSTNGVDFQGIWHELMHALKERGGVSDIVPQARTSTAQRLVGCVDPEIVKYAWDALLSQAGADILHHVLSAGTMVRDGRVTGVLVETVAGRRAILAERVVDCTGNGCVCAEAGVPWESGVDGKPWTMGMNLVCRFGNVPGVAQAPSGQTVAGLGRRIAARHECFGWSPRLLRVDPLDPWAVTRAEREGRAKIWERLQQMRTKSGHENVYLVDTANEVGVRSSRRIRGIAAATARDAWEFRKHSDGIARCSWEIDVHSAEDPAAKAVPYDTPRYEERVKRANTGEYFDIRYGCIVADGVDNLLVAGRCLSAEQEAQGALRIQQTCIATGQAAGTAAALSLKAGTTPRELDPMLVVAQLEKDRAAVEPAFDILKGLPLAPRA